MSNLAFHHIYAPSDQSLEIIEPLLKRTVNSGILDRLDYFNIIITGPNREFIANNIRGISSKFTINLTDTNDSERTTLYKLYSMVKPEDKILYFHSKGTSQIDSCFLNNIKAWGDKLMYFVVDKHQECLDFLDEYDLVGPNYWGEFTPDSCRESCGQDKNPPPHYSGNFWWAKGSHIKRLDIPIGPDYNDPEFWVFTKKPLKVVAMSVIVTNPYTDKHDFESYKNEKPKFSLLD
jgi:hypothetical protein